MRLLSTLKLCKRWRLDWPMTKHMQLPFLKLQLSTSINLLKRPKLTTKRFKRKRQKSKNKKRCKTKKRQRKRLKCLKKIRKNLQSKLHKALSCSSPAPQLKCLKKWKRMKTLKSHLIRLSKLKKLFKMRS